MYSYKVPHRITRRLFTLFFLCLSSLPLAAQNDSFEAAENIPANIHNVTSGGYWSAGKDEGFFRAVVTAGGVEHVVHRLYIQWLKNNPKTQDYELVRTVNVKELNLGHGHVMNVKTSFGDINAFSIKVTANSRGCEPKHFTIIAKGNGKYTFTNF